MAIKNRRQAMVTSHRLQSVKINHRHQATVTNRLHQIVVTKNRRRPMDIVQMITMDVKLMIMTNVDRQMRKTLISLQAKIKDENQTDRIRRIHQAKETKSLTIQRKTTRKGNRRKINRIMVST